MLRARLVVRMRPCKCHFPFGLDLQDVRVSAEGELLVAFETARGSLRSEACRCVLGGGSRPVYTRSEQMAAKRKQALKNEQIEGNRGQLKRARLKKMKVAQRRAKTG